jgi:hypothetical protein
LKKARLVPVIIGAILLALSLVAFTLPDVGTVTDETYRLSWDEEKTYTLQPNGELTLEFTWLGFLNSTIYIDAGNFIDSHHVFLNSYHTSETVHFINSGRTDKSYTVDLWLMSGDVRVHAVVKKDFSTENALAGIVLVVFGLVFISLAAIKNRERVRESRSGRRTVQTLGIIFVIVGIISFFLFPLGLLIPFFNVGMIIIGVEMIIIAGRPR